MCGNVGGVCVSTSACGGQKRSLKLQLETFVSYPMWILGTRLGSSARTVSLLYQRAICPTRGMNFVYSLARQTVSVTILPPSSRCEQKRYVAFLLHMLKGILWSSCQFPPPCQHGEDKSDLKLNHILTQRNCPWPRAYWTTKDKKYLSLRKSRAPNLILLKHFKKFRQKRYL